MAVEKIQEIRKRFRHEWLLISVDEIDPSTTIPLTGHLVAHSADPMEVHRIAQQSTEKLLMTEYSDDWPADLAACFYVKIHL